MPAAPNSGGSLGDLYSKCVQMVNENKISTKNAWELPLIDHMDSIVDSFMGGRKTKSGGGGSASAGGRPSVGGSAPGGGGNMMGDENRFHEASCTIEASARIYACRVDCVHTDTYRVLGGLNSAEMDAEEGEDGKGPASKKRRICGVNTLEKNEASLIQTSLESDEQSDPSFRRMAAAFDAGGAKGLLLSHLPIAEDLSLVFNGDVPLNRAKGHAEPMFGKQRFFPSEHLGLGKKPASKFGKARVCPGVDAFRQQFWGKAMHQVELPERIEAVLGAALAHVGADAGGDEAPPAVMGGGASMPAALGDTGAAPFAEADVTFGIPEPDMGFPDGGDDDAPLGMRQKAQSSGSLALPLNDMEGAIVPVHEDVIAFDELFQKFCGAGGSHQFAYFDKCWRKAAKESKEAAGESGAGGSASSSAVGAEGATASPSKPAPKEKPAKKPLFDLAGLHKPPKPIETEPVHKHQLSERAVQWQLHKDVPPYMIDRITMPSWPTWSKCDFACLGLRPHLMLKLMKKQAPEGPGPHRFTDLFASVVVENPDAFPWLLADARTGAAGQGDDDDAARAEREMEMGGDGDDDNFGVNGGLPAHLDVDPQDLFLRPDDKVLPDSDHEGDYGGGGFGGFGGFGDGGGGGDMFGMGGLSGDEGNKFGGVDFDLMEKPATVGDTEIGYSRNSKFVDVKLVKKHLWDCINEEIEDAKARDEAAVATSSFQELVDRTVRRMPKAEMSNLSVAVCFICALHLCNEKSLELKVDPEKLLGDFSVLGPPS